MEGGGHGGARKLVQTNLVDKEKIMPRKNKIDPSVFFDLAAEGAGPRTGRADGVTNREVTTV